MSEQVRQVLQILLDELTGQGEKYLPKAYAIGKGYASAKSGFDIGASPLDKDMAYAAVTFNSTQLNEMLERLDTEIMALNPAAYPSVADYMKDVERIFDKYANRRAAWIYYAEQPFFDGFIQGSKEIAPDLAQEFKVPDNQMGFTWRTANDEDVCLTCRGLNGQWFPLTAMEVAWIAHIGCRCPEFFEYGPNPEYKGEGVLG